MSFWTAIFMIVVVCAIAEVFKAKYRSEKGITRDYLGNETVVGSKVDPDAQRELEDLRERIKVLERIATDGNSLDASETQRIAAEIEALRDKQVEKDN
ncbi:hypothetical protein K3179_02240 [Qipengyuania sp. GH38]|jgi:hypothetical protein|uniref:hypothetical protein n=1 Tax=Qipengyuania intermedia TaxID=2867244 RepID=UPI001C880D86|nr:hypothetical protein [Qipengyuania intermedia]MBX7513361.1 hypothetical protein [Qipengyuania intermedia]